MSTMGESNETGSLPIRPFSDAQASIVDFLIPGFTPISTAVQWYLTIDLSVYAPLLCFFGLFGLACQRICKYLWGSFETYYTSTVHLRYYGDAHDMLMLWISSQSVVENARFSLVTTDLASLLNRSKNDRSNGEDANRKTLYYTPWNGRFPMWYKGRRVVFQRHYRVGDFSSREEVSISCFGRSPQILKELLDECRAEYAKLVQGKTCLYEPHQDGNWRRSKVSIIRSTSTVILNESKKRELLEDIGEFLGPASQKWYSDREIPYRRGYLLYGPPGTGKSFLSCAIAGAFGLDIFTLNLSAISEASLKSLFDSLPSHCIILLEDIDAVSSNRDAETEDSRQIATSSPSRRSKSVGGKVSLSALLNVIDGVGSQEGRILIMTTNHITRLDEAFIRPGRVDKKVELGLADKKMTADLFCLIFKPIECNVAPSENAQSDVLVGLGEGRKAHGCAASRSEEAERVELLAKDFAIKVPELKFSPAEISSFLQGHKKSPEEAIDNVGKLISKSIGAKPKRLISEDAKPENTQPETDQASKWDEESVATKVPTEMVQTSIALAQLTTPPSSPKVSPSKCFITLSDAQELVKAVIDMQMLSGYAPKYTCSHTPPEDPSEATSTDLCPPTPYQTPLSNEPSSHAVLVQLAQQFLDILKSLDTKQDPPPPPPATADKAESEEPPARASECEIQTSRLEFKTVDELWDGKTHAYAIVESMIPVGQVTGLDQYVFVVRRRVDKKTKETTCYIDVKSELLRDILRDVLKDIGGVSMNESKLCVEQNLLYTTLPELELCHGWNEIAPLDYQGILHLGLLVDYLKSAYADTAQSMLSLLSTGYITYDLLWALFTPNCLVYTTCSGTHKHRCVRYSFGEEKKTMHGVTYWSLDCRYLDFNGEDLGLLPIQLTIAKFRGAKRINALEAFPLQYHVQATRIRADLLRCGRKFMSLMGANHCHCNGNAFYMRDGEPVEVRIDSRIMVDAAWFRKMNPNYFKSIVIDPDHGLDISAFLSSFKYGSSVESFSDTSDTSSETSDISLTTTFDLEGSVVEQAEITDEYLLLCCPTVPGFSFKDKLWVEFAVADIKEINWFSAPFDCLTLPDDQRETIMAVIETGACGDPDPEFDNIVEGKGRGIIVLLHGNPGVGKTLTAEAIAELRRKPLYSISVGELPTDASKLESQLFKIFRAAGHWDAILLLDEADVFLEERAPKDMIRNGVVSVFLRTMEYCQGIMLLTTNRVSNFDPAALSRIHLKVKYDDLKSEARREVWRDCLTRARTSYGAANISADELEHLSNTCLNGREIHNTVTIARKLAIKQKSSVLFSHVKQAVAASKEFLIEFNGPDHASSIFL